MIDQTNTPNLVDLCPTTLKKVAGTNGGEWKGACPVCGGKDRFTVQPNAENGGKWVCRQCSKGGDPIAFCEFAFGDDFKQACDRLGITPNSDGWQPPAKPTAPPPPVHPSEQRSDYPAYGDDWQSAAARFVVESMALLWSPAGKNAYGYLLERGLRWNVIRAAWLGYNPRYREMRWGDQVVKLPRGIVIPWVLGGSVRKVKIRKSNYDMKRQRQRLIERGVPESEIKISKYAQAKGAISHDLYRIREIRPGKPVVMVETELDALLVQTLGDGWHGRFTAVATGSASDGFTPSNAALLAASEHVYCALDGDSAGYQGFLKWRYALGNKQITRMQPSENDPGEIFEKFGRYGLKLWLNEQMTLNKKAV